MDEKRQFELEDRLVELLPEAISVANELADGVMFFGTEGLELTNISDGEHLALYPELLWKRPGKFPVSIDTACQDLLCCELASSELQRKLGAHSLLTIREGDQIHWCITGHIDRQSVSQLYELASGRSCH